ncbi:hypothetical protein V461_19255 [Pantoea ananatis BRT98]|nr:hypothetical protein V461_19255 [Pantoea ananatis BRT98]
MSKFRSISGIKSDPCIRRNLLLHPVRLAQLFFAH